MPVSHKHNFLKYPDYVSPLPADELIKVGMVKQDLYSKGVEKTQEYVDQLDQAGLGLVRDVDKKYFAQEMDKFMKAVNESAGKTDFSNITNVRNILNIGKPLENNPYILSAIQGSQEVMRRQDTLSKLNPKERSAANDWEFTKDMEEWYNDQQVGAKLASGKVYTPYVNPTEYVMNAIKNVKPKIREEVVSKNGYLKETAVEELTNQRLKEWMHQSLPENIVNQIVLDANFKAKDAPIGHMVDYYRMTRHKQYEELQTMLTGYEKVKDYLNPTQKQEYEELRLQKEILLESLGNPPQTEQDAKQAWVQDHYNDFITGQAKLYAYQEQKEKMQADPFSLASYQSSLRKAEAFYDQGLKYGLKEDGTPRNLYDMETLKQESKMDLAEFKLKNQIAKLPPAEKKLSEKASTFMDSVTKGFTVGNNWENLDQSQISAENLALLKEALKKAMKGLNKSDSGDDFNTKDVQIKSNSDGTHIFRVNTGNGDVFEVWQDKFESALRGELGLQSSTPFLGDMQNNTQTTQTTQLPTQENQSTTGSPDTLTIADLMEAYDIQSTKTSAYKNR